MREKFVFVGISNLGSSAFTRARKPALSTTVVVIAVAHFSDKVS